MIGADMFEWPDLITIVLLVLLEGLLSADNALVLAVLVLSDFQSISRSKPFGTASSAPSSSEASRRCWPCTSSSSAG